MSLVYGFVEIYFAINSFLEYEVIKTNKVGRLQEMKNLKVKYLFGSIQDTWLFQIRNSMNSQLEQYCFWLFVPIG